jgi:hypothetical protein
VRTTKIRGALEGLTISEMVEGARNAYPSKIKTGNDRHIDIKILDLPLNHLMISETKVKTILIPKRSKALVVPR